MKMTKCIKGHIYNAEKFHVCPHCLIKETQKEVAVGLEVNQEDIDTEEPSLVKQQKYEIVGRRKVVGCLVCVKGTMAGEGFFLVEGENDIGRAANLEVVLSKELTVSRKPHACISFEEGSYMLTPAKEKKDVWCNGVIVQEDVLLVKNDMIQIAQCILRFIPFYDESFSWEG